MSMSKKRKNLQAKLRRKYNYQTNTNYDRGVMLIKPNAESYMLPHRKDKHVVDMALYIDAYQVRRIMSGDKSKHLKELRLYLTKLRPIDNNHWEEFDNTEIHLSFEELELLYNIAKEAIYDIKEEMSDDKN